MVGWLTEKDLKESFGVKVRIECDFINYRAYEESIKGIEREIKTEIFSGRRERLFKIRREMKKILKEL